MYRRIIEHKFLILICVLGIFLRTFKILDYPVQLNHDEVSQIYDAISIAKTGKDIYGNFLPTMIISINDYKSPFYTYATALTYYIFGDQEFIIKIPGLLFSILTIPAVYLLTFVLSKNKKVSLLAAALTAISPFEIFYARKSFETVAGLFFLVLGFSYLIRYTEERINKFLQIGLISLALGMYTYFSHAVIIPILITISILVNNKVFLLDKKKIFKSLIIFGVLILPLLTLIYTNPGSRERSKAVFLTQDINLGQQLSLIKSNNQILDSVVRLKVTADYAFNKYINQFNFEYLFLDGLELTNHPPLGMGILFLVSLPFLLIGAFYLIRDKNIKKEIKQFILIWILIGMVPSGLTFEDFSHHRVIMVFLMFDIIGAFGLYKVLEKILIQKNIFKYTYVFIPLLFVFNLAYFYHLYFINYAFEKSQYIQYPFKQVSLFAWSQHDNYQKIVFDPKFGEEAPFIGTAAHYYLGYYGKFPPAKMQKEYRLGDQQKREVLFDKFSIRSVNWAEDYKLKNTLLIASPWSLDINGLDKSKIINTFYFKDGRIAFYALKLD